MLQAEFDIPYGEQVHVGVSLTTRMNLHGIRVVKGVMEKATIIRLLPANREAPKVIKLHLHKENAQHLTRIYFTGTVRKVPLYSDYNRDPSDPPDYMHAITNIPRQGGIL